MARVERNSDCRQSEPVVAVKMVLRVAFVCLVMLGAATAYAADGSWTVEVAPVFVDVYGHDQHVLTIRETDVSSGTVSQTGVTLDTGATTGYRGEVRYDREVWSFGMDFTFVTIGQKANRRATSAGSAIEFVVSDATFTSAAPGEVLYFDVLEDTDVNAWTFDLYATRLVGGTRGAGVELLMGLRVADFDNDYRAVAGVENAGGLRFDASSNYGAMSGPIVGLSGRFERGRNALEGFIAQSVVLGETELSTTRRTFTGPFSAEPVFVSEKSLSVKQDIAIPMMDVRLEWRYRLMSMLSLGLGAHASAWWDVSVPPGVLPVEGGDVALHENTLIFYGFAGLIEFTF